MARLAVPASSNTSVPWHQRPHLRIKVAAEVAGVSPASIYRAAGEGKITLKRLAGCVVVDMPTFLRFVQDKQEWSPSNRGQAARAKRADLARRQFA